MAIDTVQTKNVPTVQDDGTPYVKLEKVADFSKAMQTSGSVPTGYSGAEGLVEIDGRSIKTTGLIEGHDPGFFVEVEPLDLKGAKYLSLYIKGDIFQKQGWEHYASIQVKDEDGNKYILKELCKGTQYEGCTGKGQTKTKISDVITGTTLLIPLPKELKSAQRIEVVFIGEVKVKAGFKVDDIQFMK
jgi:hypothetical protein